MTLLVVAASPLLAKIDPTSIRPSGPTATAIVQEPAEAAIRPPTSTGLQSEAITSPPQTSEPSQVVPSNVSSSPAGRLPAWLTFRPIHLPALLTWFLFGAYLMGIVILLAQLARSYLRLAQLKRTSSPFDRPILQAGRRTVAVRYSEQITVPMAAGLNHPMILIPKDLEEQLGKAELEHVVLHELGHLARRDDWTKLFQRILQTLFFFHPAVHFIGWRLNLEREVASDDWVIAQRGQERREYASSLVRLVELALHSRRMRQPLVEGSAVMVKTQLEKRIKLLLNSRRRISSRISSSQLVPGLALVFVGGFLLAQLIPTVALARVSTPGTVVSVSQVSADPINLTNSPGTDGFHTWSPDGQKIAFLSTRDGNMEIHVMNADGSDPSRITNNSGTAGFPVWSPDGQQIAFVSNRDGNEEIYVMNADGSGEAANLTNNSANDHGPAWSPDGELLAFSSDRVGNPEIYVMSPDGTGVTRLTNDLGGVFVSRRGVFPVWSPDGEQIAFHSSRDRGNLEVFVVNADGTDETNVTNNNAWDVFPAWSPSGDKIAFLTYGGAAEIIVMNADGSNPIRLTDDIADVRQPVWSPDGTRIAFESHQDGNDEIYVINADGSNPIRLTNDVARDRMPAWSPDGTRIAFTRFNPPDGNLEIFVVNVDGIDPSR